MKVYGSEPQLKRMYLNEHLRSECSLRPFECEHCGYKDTYIAITGDTRRRVTKPGVLWYPHYKTCPELPISCPNECGVKKIKRKDMEYHQMDCPLERIECPFFEAGCKDKVVCVQLDEHLVSNQQAYVLMMMKDYKEMKRKLYETEQKLSSAIATIQLLQHSTTSRKGAINLAIDCSQKLSKEVILRIF